MFDLKNAISDWRKQMLAAGIKSPVPLDELESHLREDVERQMHLGTAMETAFAIAVERMGKADDLKLQFEPTVQPLSASERKVTGILLVVVLGLYATLGVGFFVGAKASLAERAATLAAVFFTVLTGLSGRAFLYRHLPLIPTKRYRITAQVALFVPLSLWLTAFVYLVLPRVDFTAGQLVAAFAWAMSPIGILNAFITGLDEAAWQKSVLADS